MRDAPEVLRRGGGLFAEAGAKAVELAGAAQEDVAASDELRVFNDEDLARGAEVELGGFVTEELAVNAGPDEAAVSVDVDLGDAELGGGEVFVDVNAHGAGDGAAGGVDAGDFVLGNGAGAVHDEGEAGDEVFDLLEDVEVEGLLALELEGAMRGADGAGEGITAGELDELLGLDGIGEGGVAILDLDIFLDAAEHTEFGLDGDALGVGLVYHALGNLDVLLERIVGGVDHDGAEEPGIDAVITGLLVPVVEMHREDGLWENLASRADDGLEHALVGVAARALGNLDDEGGFRIDRAFEEAHGLLGVVDVVGADGVFSVGVFEELRGGDDHRWMVLKPLFNVSPARIVPQGFSLRRFGPSVRGFW